MEEQDARLLALIKERLRPYELWVTRLQEIFFFRRPHVLNIAMPMIYLTCAFIYFHGLGIFSSFFLIVLIVYIVAAFYCYTDHKFIEYLFPSELPELDKDAPNRTRSLDEICELILKFWKCLKSYQRELNSTTRTMIACIALVAVVILKNIKTFWINFVILNVLIYAPWFATMPSQEFKEQIEKEKIKTE